MGCTLAGLPSGATTATVSTCDNMFHRDSMIWDDVIDYQSVYSTIDLVEQLKRSNRELTAHLDS